MYVIKNERLKNYLYALGFNYKTSPDRTGKQEYIYLFNETEELLEAITFYTKTHSKTSKNFKGIKNSPQNKQNLVLRGEKSPSNKVQ